MRHKNEDMVNFNPDKLLEVDDISSLDRFTQALGKSRTYLRGALAKGRINRPVLESICRYYQVDPDKIIITKSRVSDDAVLDLMDDLEKRISEQIELIRIKANRDNAELRTIITSLQAQVEQLKNERRTA